MMADDAKLAMRGLIVVAKGDSKRAAAMLIAGAMAAASVDGKLHQGEYRQINGLIVAALGEDYALSFEGVKSVMEKNEDLETSDRDFVRMIFNDVFRVDQDAAAAFIAFLAEMLCADGDASWKEKAWLRSLYE